MNLICRLALTPPIAALAAFFASAAALGSAYIAEYVFNIYPCELCLWQRGPLWAAIVVACLLLALGRRSGLAMPLLGLLTLLFVSEMGIAMFHVGVEQHWWLGTGACTAAEATGTSPADLRAQLLGTPVARCDQVAWTLLGVSIPTWNVPFSLLMSVWMGLATAVAVKRG